MVRGETFRVKIIPRNIAKRLGNARRRLRPRIKDMVRDLGTFGVITMRELVPVKTGRLRSSIRVLAKTTGSGIDLRSSVKIGSTLPYAASQDIGSKASQGRFVPDLGRRITTGTHPGVPATNFSEKTMVRILAKAEAEVNKLVNKWKVDIRRS